MTKSNVGAGVFRQHMGCPWSDRDRGVRQRGNAYKSAAVDGTRSTAGIQRPVLGSLGPVPGLVTK